MDEPLGSHSFEHDRLGAHSCEHDRRELLAVPTRMKSISLFEGEEFALFERFSPGLLGFEIIPFGEIFA